MANKFQERYVKFRTDKKDKYYYTGQIDSSSKYHGLGLIQWNEDQSLYLGQWKNDSREGYGLYSWKSGDFFVGIFRGGKRYKGIYFYSNGDIEFSFPDNYARDNSLTYYFDSKKQEMSLRDENGDEIKSFPDVRLTRSYPRMLKKFRDAIINARFYDFEQGTNSDNTGWNFNGEIQRDGSYINLGCIYWEGDSFYCGTWSNCARNGVGMYKFENGTLLFGDYKENKLSGFGFKIFEDGSIDFGDFTDSKANGMLVCFKPDYAFYYGYYKDNSSQENLISYTHTTTRNNTRTNTTRNENTYNNSVSGQGKFTEEKDEKYTYIGQFNSNGESHGCGLITYEGTKNSEHYFGDWDRNTRAGIGCYMWENGDLFLGRYADNKRQNGVYIYKNGNITFNFPDNKFEFVYFPESKSLELSNKTTDKLIKAFHDTKMVQNYLDFVNEFHDAVNYARFNNFDDGTNNSGTKWYFNGEVDRRGNRVFGCINWDGGSFYCGTWKDGCRHGVGIYKFDDGTVYFGQINENDFEGWGFKIFSDGEIDFGEFGEDVANGLLFSLRKNGDFYNGLYKNNSAETTYISYEAGEEYDNNTGSSYDDDNTDSRNNRRNNGSLDNTDETTDERTDDTVEEEVDAEEELNNLIGLQSVKNEIKLIKAIALKSKGKKWNLHMAFIGNPGTGKTVVARLVGKILYKNGILKNTNFVEVSREDLVAGYIGQTAIKTKEAIDKAMGGVLFIDEAYSLNGGDGDFGKEAVETLLKAMEDRRGQFCCILAGYTKEMQELFNLNPGFKSRVQNMVNFPNYSRNELMEIAKLQIPKGYTVSEDKVLELLVDSVYRNHNAKDYANARNLRIALEKVLRFQAVRTLESTEDMTITIEDVKQYLDTTHSAVEEDNAEETLKNLIGLESVKYEIEKIKAFAIKNIGGKISLHMAFTGNPGTGKTVVARLVGKILYKYGILENTNFVEASRDTLVSGYIGQTAIKTKEAIDKAMGGVLFIDEAYTLNGGDNDFGKEAVETLLKEMEDKNGKFCCILAGYSKEMQELFNVNPGFASRVTNIIEFPNYSEEELVRIGQLQLPKTYNYETEDVVKKIAEIVYSKHLDRNYANARDMRTTIEKILRLQAVRTIDDSSDKTIRMIDVEDYMKTNRITIKKEVKYDAVEMINIDDLYDLTERYTNTPFDNIKVDVYESVVSLVNGGSESSGFIISPDGYAVTCAHCVRDTVRLKATIVLHDRKGNPIPVEYDAQVVARDELTDLAVIKLLNVQGALTYLHLEFERGYAYAPLNKIIIVGYPFGVSRFNTLSVFEGKIASYQYGRRGKPDFVNIDCSAKSGNSGSCVVDFETGRVIGVLCGSELSRSGDLVEEVNYCRPISYVWELIDLNNK